MELFRNLFGLGKRVEETPPADKPGRNDPCWCGSGKKYKKCHLAGDDRQAAGKSCSLNCGPT